MATVEHPMPSTPVPVGTKTVTGPFNTSAQAVQWTQFPMGQTRNLKVDLAITLAQGQVLDLGNYVKLVNQASGDNGDEGHNWFLMTTDETTQKLFVKTASLTEDGLVKKEAQVHLFMDSNWDHLSHEFAQGHGEYLASLASLLDVAPANYPSFFSRWFCCGLTFLIMPFAHFAGYSYQLCLIAVAIMIGRINRSK